MRATITISPRVTVENPERYFTATRVTDGLRCSSGFWKEMLASWFQPHSTVEVRVRVTVAVAVAVSATDVRLREISFGWQVADYVFRGTITDRVAVAGLQGQASA